RPPRGVRHRPAPHRLRRARPRPPPLGPGRHQPRLDGGPAREAGEGGGPRRRALRAHPREGRLGGPPPWRQGPVHAPGAHPRAPLPRPRPGRRGGQHQERGRTPLPGGRPQSRPHGRRRMSLYAIAPDLNTRLDAFAARVAALLSAHDADFARPGAVATHLDDAVEARDRADRIALTCADETRPERYAEVVWAGEDVQRTEARYFGEPAEVRDAVRLY